MPGITANGVTAIGLYLALGTGLFAYYDHLYVGLTLFAASAVCDAFDGSIARASNRATEFGLYFDVADRFSVLRHRCRSRSACTPIRIYRCRWRFYTVARAGLWPQTSFGHRADYVWES
jgi:hypothetical protein